MMKTRPSLYEQHRCFFPRRNNNCSDSLDGITDRMSLRPQSIVQSLLQPERSCFKLNIFYLEIFFYVL